MTNFFQIQKNLLNKVYPNQLQRQPYLSLKSWPSPRDEAWKFSRLGKLARKNILPLNLENQQDISINKINKRFYILQFLLMENLEKNYQINYFQKL